MPRRCSPTYRQPGIGWTIAPVDGPRLERHGFTGVVNGGVTYEARGALDSEPMTTAAVFDGTTGWIDLGNPAPLQTANGSVEAWVKTTNTDSDYHAIAIKWVAYSLFLRNGTLVTFDWGAGQEWQSNVFVADGQWHHVVLSFASGIANGSELYVDGNPAATATITVADQANDAIIGSGSTADPQQFFPGSIDEVAYYDTPLTAARVLAHYNAARYAGLIAATGPSAWYRFEDAVGSTTVADSSGDGLTGTVQGTVTFGEPGALTHEGTTKAALFDGTTGWIDLGNPAALRVANGSVEAWVNTTNADSDYHAIAIKWLAYSLFLVRQESLGEEEVM